MSVFLQTYMHACRYGCVFLHVCVCCMHAFIAGSYFFAAWQIETETHTYTQCNCFTESCNRLIDAQLDT